MKNNYYIPGASCLKSTDHAFSVATIQNNIGFQENCVFISTAICLSGFQMNSFLIRILILFSLIVVFTDIISTSLQQKKQNQHSGNYGAFIISMRNFGAAFRIIRNLSDDSFYVSVR
jgi:hypothetical protein